jgi:hypothetical protein
MRRVWLADAATELGIGVEALIQKLVAGELRAFGCTYGKGLPQLIPPEHFILPPREHDMLGPDDLAALIDLGHVALAGTELPDNPVRLRWVDPDTGEVHEAVHPSSCIDPEANLIYADNEPAWTDIQIMLESERAGTNKRKVSLDAYRSHQEQTKAKTGHWSSNAHDEKWAKENSYSRDSVRAARLQFKGSLSEIEREVFEASGPRN